MLHYQLLGLPQENENVFRFQYHLKDKKWFYLEYRRPWNKIKFHLESIYCINVFPPLWFHWKNNFRIVWIDFNQKLYSTIINLNDNNMIVHWFCTVRFVLILKRSCFFKFEWKSRGSTITFILSYCFDIPWEGWRTTYSMSMKIVVMGVQLVLHCVQ